MTDKEIMDIAFKCGIIAWTRHDYLMDRRDFRDLPIDEGMDGDKACLLQFAKEIMSAKREWVGLTRKEAEDVVDDFITIGGDVENWVGYWQAIEAKLKEKNA